MSPMQIQLLFFVFFIATAHFEWSRELLNSTLAEFNMMDWTLSTLSWIKKKKIILKYKKSDIKRIKKITVFHCTQMVIFPCHLAMFQRACQLVIVVQQNHRINLIKKFTKYIYKTQKKVLIINNLLLLNNIYLFAIYLF